MKNKGYATFGGGVVKQGGFLEMRKWRIDYGMFSRKCFWSVCTQ